MAPRYNNDRNFSSPLQVAGEGLNTDRASLRSHKIALVWPIVWKSGASEFLGIVGLKGKL